MSQFFLRTERGELIEGLTPETLRQAFDSAPGALVITNSIDPAAHAAAHPLQRGRWQVTIHRAGDDADSTTTAPNADAAFDLLRSWAADDDWWLEAFSWEPADH